MTVSAWSLVVASRHNSSGDQILQIPAFQSIKWAVLTARLTASPLQTGWPSESRSRPQLIAARQHRSLLQGKRWWDVAVIRQDLCGYADGPCVGERRSFSWAALGCVDAGLPLWISPKRGGPGPHSLDEANPKPSPPPAAKPSLLAALTPEMVLDHNHGGRRRAARRVRGPQAASITPPKRRLRRTGWRSRMTAGPKPPFRR